MPDRTSWINVVSLDHVEAGVAGGFTQSDHGKPDRLRRLSVGDRIAFYSPWTKMRSGRPLQQLSALGRITGRQPYQVEVRYGFEPWRITVDFATVTPVDIHPLLADLSFIPDPDHWGLPFRQGLFRIPEADMDLIARALQPT